MGLEFSWGKGKKVRGHLWRQAAEKPVLRKHQLTKGHWCCWHRARGTHPADAIHADVAFARLAGRPIHHGLPVLVVEALPLGDAGQLTLVWGWERQRGKRKS